MNKNGFLTKIIRTPLFWIILILIVAFIAYKSVSVISPIYYCNKPIIDWDRKYAQNVLDACNKVIKLPFPWKIKALKNAGRASLISWNPEWDDKNQEDKENLIEQTKQYFQQVHDQNSEDPQAAFYMDFMADFETVVVKAEKCQPAIRRYNSEPGTTPPIVSDKSRTGTIDLYLNSEYKIQPSDFFLLTELGHFLVNRYSEINRIESYQKATDIFELFEKNSEKPEQYYNILISKGILQAEQGLPNKARETFDNARTSAKEAGLKAYKIDYYLGTAYIQLGSAFAAGATEDSVDSYNQAANYYDRVIQPEIAENFYQAWRNRGLITYLLGLYYEQHNQTDDAVEFYEKAGSSFKRILGEDRVKGFDIESIDPENKELIVNLKNQLESCSVEANCLQADRDLSKLEDKIKTVITKNSYYIIHEGTGDPFFEVEHDKFYSCME
jgi:tetratricopeptide (TPR) repeat protein